jgi:hypothetical protein
MAAGSTSARLEARGVNALDTSSTFKATNSGLTTLFEVKNAGKVDVRGQISAQNAYLGSAGVPAYSFHTDTDTGMYSPLADTIALSTGGTERWSISSAGVLQSNGAQTVQTSTGDLTLATAGGNGNITLAPNGTGDVFLDADTVRVGDSNANATITTNGTGDLILNTNSGTNSGSITIFDAANGNITLAPNGTGVVAIGSGSQSWTLNGSSTANLIIQDSTPTTRLTLSNAGALTSVSSLTASNVAVGVTANTINSTTGDLTITTTAATGTLNLPTGVTTGTTTDAAIFMNYDSVTTGDGIFMTADALTSGSAIHLDSSATVLTTGKLLEVTASAYDGASTSGLVEISSISIGRVTQSSLLRVASSGANASSTIESRGATISVTNTGTTSTNVGLTLTASGATTNRALNITAGELALNGAAGTSGQLLKSAGANNLPTWGTIGVSDLSNAYRYSADSISIGTTLTNVATSASLIYVGRVHAVFFINKFAGTNASITVGLVSSSSNSNSALIGQFYHNTSPGGTAFVEANAVDLNVQTTLTAGTNAVTLAATGSTGFEVVYFSGLLFNTVDARTISLAAIAGSASTYNISGRLWIFE